MTTENVRDVDTALQTALSESNYERAEGLLSQGANVNRVMRRTVTFDRDVVEDTRTYLIDAATVGDSEMVQFLLGHGADPNIAGEYCGETALLAAASQSQCAVIDLLLAGGADVNAIDTYSDRTALGYAVEKVNPSIVESLLAAGAPPRFRRLGFSIEGGSKARAVVRLLVKYGADINALDDWGRTPLMWAATYAEAETVGAMIELGAAVNRISEANMNGVKSNETALALARERNRDDVIAVLVAHGAREVPLVRHHGSPLLTRIWDMLTG